MQLHEQKIKFEHKRAVIHSFSPYLATFPDEIPKYVIDNYLPPVTLSKNCGGKKLILDPFCGSGTTLVVAAENNVKAIGVDYNPMAVMITNAKCCSFNECEDFRDARKLLEKIKALKPFSSEGSIDFTVNLDKVKYWFHSKVAEDLFLLRDRIKDCGNEKVRNLALVIYAVTLRVCSYGKNDTLSRARKTYSIIEASRADAFKDFTERFNKALELKKKQRLLVTDNTAIEGDSRKLIFDDGLFDGIITSPPYLAGINYSTPFDLFHVFMNQKLKKTGFINGEDEKKFFEVVCLRIAMDVFSSMGSSFTGTVFSAVFGMSVMILMLFVPIVSYGFATLAGMLLQKTTQVVTSFIPIPVEPFRTRRSQ